MRFKTSTRRAAPATPSGAAPSGVPIAWSDRRLWGGAPPGPGESAIIPAGKEVVIDVPINCQSIQVAAGGLLRSDGNSNVRITARTITVDGSLRIGTKTSPYTGSALISLWGTPSGVASRSALVGGGFTNDGTARALIGNVGSSIELWTPEDRTHRTRLAANVSAGATTIYVVDATGWKKGDVIAVGPTGYRGTTEGVTQRVTLTADPTFDGTKWAVPITPAMAAGRWGSLQYYTGAGLSLTNDGVNVGNCAAAAASMGITAAEFVAKHASNVAAGAPTVLDARAMVVNLTRRIVVEGQLDNDWTVNKIGAHMMFMGRTSRIHLSGVQVNRGGQMGHLGRYPFHLHMLSYGGQAGGDLNLPSDGTFLGNVTDQEFRHCTVDGSGQRGVVVHGTCGAIVDRHVTHDTLGMTYFLEDHAEQDNFIRDCVAMKVNNPTVSIQDFDIYGTGAAGSAGFWLTNPKNTITGNWATDCETIGIWHAFSNAGQGTNGMRGLCKNVTTKGIPQYTPVLNFANNIGMCNRGSGVMTDRPVNFTTAANMDSGVVSAAQEYRPMSNSLATGGTPVLPQFVGYQTINNDDHGYQNRIGDGSPIYTNWTFSGNNGNAAFGATLVGFLSSGIFNALIVGEDLNPNRGARRTHNGFTRHITGPASYHDNLQPKGCLYANFVWRDAGATQYSMSGFLSLWDYYLSPVGMSWVRAVDNIRAGCDLAWLAKRYRDDSSIAGNEATPSFNPGPVQKDYDGFLTGYPGRYLVTDIAFYTYGTTATALAPIGTSHAAAITADVMGVLPRYTDSDQVPNWTQAFTVSRLNPADNTTVIHSINCPVDASGITRGFSIPAGGIYRFVEDAGSPNSVRWEARIQAAIGAGKDFVMSIPWAAGAVPRGVISTQAYPENVTFPATAGQESAGTAFNLTTVGSIAAVVADTTGKVMYRDTANNRLWFKWKGTALNYTDTGTQQDDNLLKTCSIVFRP